jgi:hypothetical protein
MDLPALFWDSMPENPEEHPDYAAFQAIEEECTPEERAASHKAWGSPRPLPRGCRGCRAAT